MVGGEEMGAGISAEQLREWLIAAGMTQAELARVLGVDAGQVSRWCTGKAMPSGRYPSRIVELMRERGVRSSLADLGFRVFFSTPMAALSAEDYETNRAAATTVYGELCRIAPPVYWGAAEVASVEQFEAPDIAAERNLVALSAAEAFVYLQLCELDRPTSSHVEIGMAIASRKAVTLFAPSEDSLPYILRCFEAISGRGTGLGGRFRFYNIRTAADAVRLLTIHGPRLIGVTERCDDGYHDAAGFLERPS
jgi:transcriptional regulator with XRE-family HTH domain